MPLDLQAVPVRAMQTPHEGRPSAVRAVRSDSRLRGALHIENESTNAQLHGGQALWLERVRYPGSATNAARTDGTRASRVRCERL